MAAFDWWLLIVGLVVGGGLVWLVLADSSRREAEILEEELPVEAAWISAVLADEGVTVDQPTSERILRLHRMYLASLPPDEVRSVDGQTEADVPPVRETSTENDASVGPVARPRRRLDDGVGDQGRSGA
jgi:hypothetical protein